MKGGLILENIKPKDFSHEKLFGSANRTEKIVPLNRDVSKVPPVYQGDKPFCVAATITWIKQFMSGNVDLAHEYLAMIAKIGENGAKPSQVLEPARKRGIASQKAWNGATSASDEKLEESATEFKIAGYTRITDLSLTGLYNALKKGPIAIGVKDWKGVGPHFMAGYDVTPDGLAFKAQNWWEGSEKEIVSLKDIVCAYAFLDSFEKPMHPFRAGWLLAAQSFVSTYKFFIGAGLLALSILGGTQFGAGYTPVTGYESNLTSRVIASDTSIPVASINDKAGHAIVFANTSPSSTARIYFTLEPGGTREEIIYCTGLSGSSFTPCVRGLDFQGGGLTASSTLAKIHPAGSKIIISNVGQVYGEFVSIDGLQRIDGQKYFAVIPRQTATTTLPTENDQYATKYYVDNVGAGGLTSANASTTRGLEVFGTSPETLGVNIGTATSGLWFDSTNGYKLKIYASSTKGLYIDSNGRLAIDESDNFNWTGTHAFNSTVTSYGSLRVQTPTTSQDAVNRGYLESSIASVTSTLFEGAKYTTIWATSSRILASASGGADARVRPYFLDNQWVECPEVPDVACFAFAPYLDSLTGFSRTFRASGLVQVLSGTATASVMLYGVGSSTISGNDHTTTLDKNFVGFWMKGNGTAGTFTIHGATANGSSFTTSTSLGTFTVNDMVSLSVTFTPTSQAVFRAVVNGGAASEATISTTLPSTYGFYPYISYDSGLSTPTGVQTTYYSPLFLEF